MKKTQKIILFFCGVTVILCGILPWLLLDRVAFSSMRMAMVIVPFSWILEWAHGSGLLIDRLVGICYRVSLLLSFILIPLGMVLIVSLKIFFTRIVPRKIIQIILICLCAFYVFSIVVNIIRIDDSASSYFYLYIFSKFVIIIAIVTANIVILRVDSAERKKRTS